MIVEPWNLEMEINIESLHSLPIWVQFPKLDLKYWGLECLSKIGTLLGVPLKTDKYTLDKTFLNYARVLIDMPIDGAFPEFVEFINKHGVLVRQHVRYEWKPIKCPHYLMYRHTEPDYRKKPKPRQEWRPIQRDRTPPLAADEEGFIPVTKRASSQHPPQAPVLPTASNPFSNLISNERNDTPLGEHWGYLHPYG